eukprot:Gb_27646 [translate_table: standard]
MMDKGSEPEDALELKNGELEEKSNCGSENNENWSAQVQGKGIESMKKSDVFFRADQIDLKSLDEQLQKHMIRAWTMEKESRRPREEWEIDPTKLVVKSVIARGTYGTVHRGVYDGQDVAGHQHKKNSCWSGTDDFWKRPSLLVRGYLDKVVIGT